MYIWRKFKLYKRESDEMIFSLYVNFQFMAVSPKVKLAATSILYIFSKVFSILEYTSKCFYVMDKIASHLIILL